MLKNSCTKGFMKGFALQKSVSVIWITSSLILAFDSSEVSAKSCKDWIPFFVAQYFNAKSEIAPMLSRQDYWASLMNLASTAKIEIEPNRVLPAAAIALHRFTEQDEANPFALSPKQSEGDSADSDRADAYWDQLLQSKQLREVKSERPWRSLGDNKYGENYVSEVWINGTRKAFRAAVAMPNDDPSHMNGLFRSTSSRLAYVAAEIYRHYFRDFPYAPNMELVRCDGLPGILIDWVEGEEKSNEAIRYEDYPNNESFMFAQVYSFIIANDDLPNGSGQILDAAGNLNVFDPDQTFIHPIARNITPQMLGSILPKKYSPKIVKVLLEMRGSAREKLSPLINARELRGVLFRLEVILADIERRMPELLK